MHNKSFAILFLIFLSPVFLLLSIALFIFSGKPIFYIQKRAGKNKKVFFIYKFRTMIKGAEKLKERYLYLNEADGFVFKIKDDPRYTKIGKVISHLGLDELPQLMNIVKGEMAFVGPRPLPIEEAKQIPEKYHDRFSVLPGITSLWVVEGGHSFSFQKWMELDLYYVENKSFQLDCNIILKTILLFLKVVGKKSIGIFTFLSKNFL